MSSLVNWMYSIATAPFSWLMYTTGLSAKQADLLIIGLDNAGKTTLLGMLSTDKIMCHEPTMHPNKEEIQVGRVRFNAHDLGGHLAARRLWKSYNSCTDCVLFMVDATDMYRIEEARTELSNLIADLGDTPILVIGNKIDSPGACSKAQLCQYLGLEFDNPNIGVFMCSVVLRAGIKEAFKWLEDSLE